MDNSLLARLGSLSEKERHLFYTRLTNILNDKYSCFIYGGMNNLEYATMPKDKLEILEINLYNHMFNNLEPPMRSIIDSFNDNKGLEKLDISPISLTNKSRANSNILLTTKKKSVYSLRFQN